jgi:hypothetical protein
VLGRKVIANASVDRERSSKAAGKLKAGAGRQRGFAISRQNVYLGGFLPITDTQGGHAQRQS